MKTANFGLACVVACVVAVALGCGACEQAPCETPPGETPVPGEAFGPCAPGCGEGQVCILEAGGASHVCAETCTQATDCNVCGPGPVSCIFSWCVVSCAPGVDGLPGTCPEGMVCAETLQICEWPVGRGAGSGVGAGAVDGGAGG